MRTSSSWKLVKHEKVPPSYEKTTEEIVLPFLFGGYNILPWLVFLTSHSLLISPPLCTNELYIISPRGKSSRCISNVIFQIIFSELILGMMARKNGDVVQYQ